MVRKVIFNLWAQCLQTMKYANNWFIMQYCVGLNPPQYCIITNGHHHGKVCLLGAIWVVRQPTSRRGIGTLGAARYESTFFANPRGGFCDEGHPQPEAM